MERSEPTFVPEWLKNTTSHQLQSSSIHSDEQGVSKTTRNKSFVNISDNDLGHLDRTTTTTTTSSYFRRASSSNGGSSHLRSYSSFGRNNRDWEKDKSGDRSDPLSNILPSRFEKEGLRRSHSSISAKKVDSWPRKLVSEKNGIRSGGVIKTTFERDFPSLGADEKLNDSEIGRVPSPGLTTAIQSLPIGGSAVIGGDGWTSALAEVPVIVGSNGSSQSTSISATSGRNMAETLAQGPPRAQTAPQLSVGTQRLEELAVKQSRQLIPVTPSLPKALVLNSSDKPKPKVGQLQLQSSHLRPVSTKFDASKTSSSVGKLHVLKPSRERNNGTTTIAKDNMSPTNSSTVGSANNPTVAVTVVKPTTLEKRPSSQAKSRNDFFNLMRKKSMTNNNNDNNNNNSVMSDTEGSSVSSDINKATNEGDVCSANGDDPMVVDKAELSSSNGEKCLMNNGKNNSSSDSILYSEEEEARFLRSLGWEETGEEEEGLTEEEISSFYRDVSKYLNMQAASKIFKGAQPKLVMERIGNNVDESKLES